MLHIGANSGKLLALIGKERFTIFFDSLGVSIHCSASRNSPGVIVWRRQYTILRRLRGGPALVEHAKVELAHIKALGSEEGVRKERTKDLELPAAIKQIRLS